MIRSSHRFRIVPLVLLPAAFLLGACEEPDARASFAGSDEGAFVIRLGTDTVAVERFRLSPEGMEVLTVTRSPRTLHREAALSFDEEGGLARYETRTVDPADPDASPMQRTVLTFGPDGVRVGTGEEGEDEPEVVEGDPSMVPFSLTHFSLAELAIRRALAEGWEAARMWQGGPAAMELRRVGPDHVALVTPQLGTWEARVDEEGRILEMEAGALGRDVERVPGLDVDALARRFAEEDARGEGMGPLSPRDTLRTEVAGAAVTVDYSRPSARGRQVFGGLVPYGEIWRTGADRATHLTTDRPLHIGDETVPAGTYTLFTIPDPEQWTLIVNQETGQAGTAHDEEMDLLRVPMEVRRTDEHVERFTIAVEADEEDGVLLRFVWEETEALLRFEVETGEE